MADDDKQMLTVSSPCLLLNHIAQRYTRTSRIIMEYVDNSLDDSEALFNASDKTYEREIKIDVYINRHKAGDESVAPEDEAAAAAMAGMGGGKKKKKKKEDDQVTVRVVDNCRGMTKDIFSRLVVNVGDSNKRTSKFTNGQFGFGVHAFRAAANKIRFKTKSEKTNRTLSLEIDRSAEAFPHPKVVKKEEEDGIETESGTEVKVCEFDDTWSEQLDPVEIIKEIQHHFGGLLERKNLKVHVHDVAKGKSTLCKPYSFADGSASKVRKDYMFSGDKIRVRLHISQKAVQGRNAMFICKGRRINEISDVKSFMKMSRCRWAVWGHPNLVGYIDVSGVLDPVITRDEFILNEVRKDVYRKIVEEVEPKLYKLLHEVNENRRVMALSRLEDVVARCVNVAVKKDVNRNKEGMSYLQQLMMAKKPIRRKKIDEDFDVEESQPAKKRRKLDDDEKKEGEDGEKKDKDKMRRAGLGFNIAFVKDLVDENTGDPLRARLVGEDVQINMRHPDFLHRIKVSKGSSQPVVTERLCGYLANIIAASYKSHMLLRGDGLEKYKDNNALLLDEILDITLSLENQLRSKLKLMQREMDTGSESMNQGPPSVAV